MNAVKRDDQLTGAFVIRLVLCILSWSLINIILSFPIFEIVYDGIAADSSGKLYIGMGSAIHVYDDGVKVGEMGHNLMKGVDFFTVEDDQVHLWNNAYSYVMDLDGSIVEKEASPLGHEILSPRQKRNFTAENGSRYELRKGVLRWDRVIRTYPDGSEEVVFHMPLWLHLIKMAVRVYAAVTVYFFGKLLIKRLSELDF